MKKLLFMLLSILLLLAGQHSFALEPYEFPDDDLKKRFQQLTFELRCPKCQNQNIADSNAPIAKDLRREVHRMLVEGKNDDEVVDFAVERYGDFVLYRPPFSVRTFALWTLPVVLVVFGLAVAFWLGRANKNSANDKGELSPEEAQRLKQLLQEATESAKTP